MIKLKKILKRFLEKIMHIIFSRKEELLYSKIDKYDYISFDIFDTLIKRVISKPEYLFDFVEKKYNSISNNKINNFTQKRINAYKNALKASGSEDVNLESIYEYIDGIDNSEREILKKIEIELEKKICIKNKKMFDVYQYCLKNDKKIFITTDMYLPMDIIEYILKNNEYNNYIKLYISSNIGLTKRSGNLFEKIIFENNINPKKMLHIGDSPIQDFIKPKTKGIESVLIKRNIKNSIFSKNSNNENYADLKAFINNSMCYYDKLDDYSKFGYEIFGPLLLGFVDWLNKRIIDNNIDTVCFLARDSKVIMEAYQSIYQSSVSMKYLNISRKSIILSELYDIENFDDLILRLKSIIKTTTTLEEVLKLINFNLDLLDDRKINKLKMIKDLNEKEKKYIFLTIKNYVHEYSLEQKKLFDEYLNQNDIKGKVAFVDIGWRGTTQYLVLKKYPKIDLKGYYFGINLDKSFNEYDLLKRDGYLFNNVKYSNLQSIVSLSVGIFETMFLSTEGTTLRYEMNNGEKVEPIKDLPDCNFEDIEYIESIQNYAKKFVVDVKKYGMLEFFSFFENKVFFENYKNFVTKPTFKNIKLFKNFTFQGTKKSKLLENKSIIYYLLHPKIFMAELNNSYCKLFFLKNTFKIYLPYYNILNFLYKKTKL